MQTQPHKNSQSRAKAILEFDHLYERIPTGGVCFYCGDDAQTGDHVPPISTARKRDRNCLFFLVPSCQRCNHVLGNHQSVDLAKRCEYVLQRRKKLGDSIDQPQESREIFVWIMPPLKDDDRDLVGKTCEAISGGALAYIEGRLGGDLRRSVMQFASYRCEKVSRGILAGMLGRALRDKDFIWGFGVIPSMLSPDPRSHFEGPEWKYYGRLWMDIGQKEKTGRRWHKDMFSIGWTTSRMVRLLLGHTHEQITMRYAYLADDAVRRAAKENADCLSGFVSSNPLKETGLRVVK